MASSPSLDIRSPVISSSNSAAFSVVEVSGCVDKEQFLKDMETSYRHKFAKKPQVVEGNLKCLRLAMKEVRY